MDKEKIKILISSALDVRQSSYSPYSHFCVGAALMAESGKIYKGTNIENSSYPVGICAERSAFAAAISNGEHKFLAVAIVGGYYKEIDELSPFCTPCGMCRQFMNEFCHGDFIIISAKSTDNYKIYKMSELLPSAFSFNI